MCQESQLVMEGHFISFRNTLPLPLVLLPVWGGRSTGPPGIWLARPLCRCLLNTNRHTQLQNNATPPWSYKHTEKEYFIVAYIASKQQQKDAKPSILHTGLLMSGLWQWHLSHSNDMRPNNLIPNNGLFSVIYDIKLFPYDTLYTKCDAFHEGQDWGFKFGS